MSTTYGPSDEHINEQTRVVFRSKEFLASAWLTDDGIERLKCLAFEVILDGPLVADSATQATSGYGTGGSSRRYRIAVVRAIRDATGMRLRDAQSAAVQIFDAAPNAWERLARCGGWEVS